MMDNNKDCLPLVSVGIITYNQKNFLRECIDSVLEQDYPNMEIVVGDDASTDYTQDMLKDYAAKYPGKFILRLSEQNQGITKNSNVVYFACSGKYIAWMGGDDLMLPGKIRAQVAWMEENQRRVICGHILHLCDQNSLVYGILKKRLVSGFGPDAWITDGCLYGACSVMIRKESMPKYGFDNRLAVSSDWKLWIDSLAKDSIYGYLNVPYGLYRKHPNNITHQIDLIIKDSKLTIACLEKERPEIKKIIIRKAWSRIHYCECIVHIQANKPDMAIRCVINSIIKYPFHWKTYARFLQALWMLACNVGKKDIDSVIKV